MPNNTLAPKQRQKIRKLKARCWRLLSQKIRKERGNKCQFPGCRATTQLNCHHLEDARLNSGLFLDPRNIIVLCVTHHRFSKLAVHRSTVSLWRLINEVIGSATMSYLAQKKQEDFEFTEEYLMTKLTELKEESNHDQKRNGNKRSR
jgi:hypothetical protein